MLGDKKPKVVYKLTPANVLSAKYKRAKTAYFNEAERKKPKVTKEITAFGKVIGTYKSRSTGIETTLKTIEALIPGAHNSKTTRAKFEKTVDTFRKAHVQLIQALEKVSLKAPEGINKPALVTAVKKFQNELIDINRLISVENNKIKVTYGEAKSFAVMAGTLVKTIKQRIETAYGFADDVLLQPDEEQAAYFNEHVQGVARGLTQQIGNITKLSDMGYEVPGEQPTQLFEEMSPWANHGRQLKPNANEEDVISEVTDFRQVVVAIDDWAKRMKL